MLVSHVGCEFFIALVLDCIVSLRFLDRRESFLLKSSCGFSTWVSCYVFVEVIIRSALDVSIRGRGGRSRYSRIVSRDLDIVDSSWIEALASCAGLSNHLDVLGLSLLLWIVEDLEWLAFVARDANEVECFFMVVVCFRLFIASR